MERGQGSDAARSAAGLRLPRFLARARGLQGLGRRRQCYIDYLMAWGTVLLGHGDPAVEAEVARQLRAGRTSIWPIEQEVSLAERLVQSHSRRRAGPLSGHRRRGHDRGRPHRPGRHRPRASDPIRLSRLARLVERPPGRRSAGHALQRPFVRVQRSGRLAKHLPAAAKTDGLHHHGADQGEQPRAGFLPACANWPIAMERS